MTKKNVVYLVSFISIFLFTSCYPLSTGSVKWRIKIDKNLKEGKSTYMNELIEHSNIESKPNIIILVADDLGKFEIGAYGSTTTKTPNIDELANEGCVFKDAYVTAPVCAPSRAAIITGRHNNRFGFETQEMEFYPTNIIEYLSGKYLVNTDDWVVSEKPRFPREWQIVKQGVPPTEIELNELLKKYGYTNGFIGKWHLGANKKYHLPENRGFDYTYGIRGAFSLYAPEINYEDVINFYNKESFSTRHQWEMGRGGNGAIIENGKMVRREEGYITDHFEENTINFIKKNKNTPFMLYVPFTAPHEPYQAKLEDYCRNSQITDSKAKAVYWSLVESLDRAIGKIHQTVKDLGLEENTIIYLISDNGPAGYTGIPDLGPYKGGKITQFEGGVNVPFIMKWKSKIPAGIKYDYPVSSMDIFVTSVAAAGAKLPNDRVYDGVNLLPYITKQNTNRPHETIFWKADHIQAVRKGDYKLILSTKHKWEELYDLSVDAGESNNLATNMPEKVLELKKELENWRNTLPKKPMWPKIMDHRFMIRGKEYLFPA